LEDRECITLNLKEKCIHLFVLKGYGGQDDKLRYLTPYLANLTFYFGIYNRILKVILELCRPDGIMEDVHV